MINTKFTGAYQLYIRESTYFYSETSPFFANLDQHLSLQTLSKDAIGLEKIIFNGLFNLTANEGRVKKRIQKRSSIQSPIVPARNTKRLHSYELSNSDVIMHSLPVLFC